MKWTLIFLPDAEKDLKSFSGNQRDMILKAIKKVRQNPLPNTEGGYGKPLGNQNGRDLTGMQKIKLRGPGIRVVYRLIRTTTEMVIVVVGARADDVVYDIAYERRKKYGL